MVIQNVARFQLIPIRADLCRIVEALRCRSVIRTLTRTSGTD